MKKFYTVISAMIVIVLFAGAFIACNESEKENVDPTENTQFDKIVSDRITAEEWESIGDDTYNSLNKCRIVISCKVESENADKTGDLNATVLITSDVRYMKETFGDSITEYFDVFYGKKWRYFVKESGAEWEEISNTMQDGEDDHRVGTIERAMKAYSYSYAEINYYDVEYSDELKGYYRIEESNGRQIETLIKFRNGKVAELSRTVYENGMTVIGKSYIEYNGGAWGLSVPSEINTLLQAG